MTDNILVKDANGVSQTLAAKDTGSGLAMRHNLVDEANAYVAVATAANQTAAATLFGSVTETAPATDTASSGLNGRLQRVSQRITSLIALLPAALDQGTMAQSMRVVIPSDQSDLPVKPGSTETKISAAAMPSGGVGFTGWLSAIWYQLTVALPASLGVKASAASLPVVIASDQSAIPTTGNGVTYTDRSGTITTGNTAQNAMGANTSRKGFFVQNISTADLWISSVGAAAAGASSLKIKPDGLYEAPSSGVPTAAISIFGTSTGQAFAAREW